MTSTTRSVVIGAVSAVVVVAAVVGALVLRGGAAGVAPGDTAAAPSKVVVVFALAGEDNAVTAQVVATVDYATGRYELVDTTKTVAIPGTSYSELRDAYPFGGAQAVATALADGQPTAGTAWVDVSPEAWKRLLAAGFDTSVTTAFEAYDDTAIRYSEFVAGPQRVAVEDLRGLVNGLPYLPAEERTVPMRDLAAASLKALATAQPAAGIETNLTPEQWSAFATALKAE
jgi:hypothetical protein